MRWSTRCLRRSLWDISRGDGISGENRMEFDGIRWDYRKLDRQQLSGTACGVAPEMAGATPWNTRRYAVDHWALSQYEKLRNAAPHSRLFVHKSSICLHLGSYERAKVSAFESGKGLKIDAGNLLSPTRRQGIGFSNKTLHPSSPLSCRHTVFLIQ